MNAELTAAADLARRAQYGLGLAVALRLIATINPQPNRIAAECQPWTPDEVSLKAYAHNSLATLEAWREQLGGQLVSTEYDRNTHWSLHVTFGGVPVELWTLIALSDEQPGGAR
jgi:hypothetical protein